jgi:Gti1/Pac2 family transcription factor
MSLEPTFFGYVGTSHDALSIFEACRGNGILQKVSRRPHDRERDRLIKSGNIFVFDEQSSGIRRWTDGVAWSPSRILGNYLIYRQLERPLQPGEKKRAQKHRSSNGGVRSGSDMDSPERLKQDLSPDRSPSPREAGGPIRSHSKKVKTDTSSNASENGSSSNKPRRWSEEQEKELAGSLTDSYGFKDGGLIKKTMSVEYEGTVHHLVSYYTIDDVMLHRLVTPHQDARLADLTIGNDLMTRTNFRVHPSSETAGNATSRSPTQQRTQMIMGHQRRPDDPRHAQGYAPIGSYGPPPPIQGGGPPEGYPDPNAHYYGPPAQSYHNARYFPPNPPMYQNPPMFMHGAPPHMVNSQYYGVPPQQGPPPQYAPGPPQQHPPHPGVDVKRDGPPPNSSYYTGYQPYPPATPQNYPPQMSSGQGGQYPPRPPPPQQQPPMMTSRPYEQGGYPPSTATDNRNPPGPTQPSNTAQTSESATHLAPVSGNPPQPPQAQQQGGTALSRQHSGGSPPSTQNPQPSVQAPPPSQGQDTQSTFGWNNWSQSQPSQAPAPARA